MAYTDIDDSSELFQSLRWTGNATGGARDFTFTGNANMQPDMALAIKEAGSQSHMVTDSSRDWSNGNKEWVWNSNSIEGNVNAVNSGAYGWLGPGLTNGIRMSQAGNYWDVNNNLYYGAFWKVNGGTTTSFSENGNHPGGARQTNTDAGFSIITYTGTGANANCQFAHGLGVAPSFVIYKRRNASNAPCVWHKAIGDDVKLTLDSYAALDADGAFQNSTVPDATNITVGGTSTNTNADNGTYVCYAWTDVQGFSKFGSYKGNGNADGTFVYTGFRPQAILIKRTDAVSSWLWHDAKWGTKNATGTTKGNIGNLQSAAMVMESNSNSLDDYGDIDFLSNGFKIRDTDGRVNANAAPYIYAAWAEHPFVTSTGTPTTAR
tara:strand:+ start:24 stop:1154 length:1131 start_codon:yes stop_codon:yes gene_type:complete